MQRGIVAEGLNGPQALAGGIGAGLGVTWKFALGLDGAGFLVESAFLAAGILAMVGGVFYGRRIRRLRAEAGTGGGGE